MGSGEGSDDEGSSHAGGMSEHEEDEGTPVGALPVSSLVLMTVEVRMNQTVSFPTQKTLATMVRSPAVKMRGQEVEQQWQQCLRV